MARNDRRAARIRRKERVRKHIKGSDLRPRICVFRSNKHIYAQVISDERGATLVAESSLSAAGTGDPAKGSKGMAAAKRVGLALAQKCKEKNITQVVFDRNGFLFHGQIKALAEGAREGGLQF